MGLKVANNAFGTLNAGISNVATTLVLSSGEGSRFPTLSAGDYFYATLIDTSNNLEIVKVTARSTDTLTIVRAQDGTTARAYSTNDRFELRPTAALFNEKADAAELNASNLTSGTVPTARLGTGTANSATFLRGDQSWQSVPTPTIASTAEAQAGIDNTTFITPLRMREALNATGSAPVFACRAWVNFNGTGTVAIRASGNVSSITDNGSGDYTVNFTSAMPDANYAVSGFANSWSNSTGDQAGLATSYATLYPPTASAYRFTVANSWNGDVYDASQISIAIFR